VVHESDNVATALRDLERGAVASVADKSGPRGSLQLHDPIGLGHKVALSGIGAGESVVKYGQPIGRATAAIEVGRHVHVHNVESLSVDDR
jgi:altronate dehydratase small subunit